MTKQKTESLESGKNRNKLIRKISILLIGILFAVVFVTALLLNTQNTYAWLSGANSATNVFNTPTTSVSIVEGNLSDDLNGWDPPVSIPWGNSSLKFVRFKNDGTSSVLIRVSFAQTWKMGETYLSYLSNVLKDGSSVASPVFTESWKSVDNWWLGADGWYYYKHILAPGEDTGLILEGVLFNDAAAAEYASASYDLFFRVEACQYSLNPDNKNQSAAWTSFNHTFEKSTAGVITWLTDAPS